MEQLVEIINMQKNYAEMRVIMKKRLMQLISMMLAVALVFSVSSNTYATNDIEEAKKEKEELENKLKNTQAALNDLESLKGDAEAYIKKMDGYMENLTNHIYELEQQAQEKQNEITAKQAEIDDMQRQIDEQYASMKLRIQYMYENGEVSYLSMFFESQDMSDFLNRAEYLTEITEYDRNMLDKLKDAKDSLNIAKANLDNELAQLNELLKETEEERAAADVLVQAKEQELATTNSDIISKEEAIKRQKEDIAAAEALIKELEEIERKRKEEEERRRLEQLQQQQVTYTGGSMMWPLPGKTYISSYFGNRADPFTGLTAYHSGIDIPAPTGTEIHAACGGEIAWAYYSSSAGNWVGIDHGNGLYTIYMHMSKILVTEGQQVQTGDVIGLVGSTGRSTGSHLHLSVRLNGAYVEPLNYVSPN